MADFTHHEAAAHEALSLPVMLPGRPIGRDEQLKTIYAHLRGGEVVLIHGPAGVGKTALAAALGSAYAQQPGGVLWLNVNNSPLEELVVRVGRAYGVAQITGSENPLSMIGAAANTLAQHKPLIVLDGKLDAQVLTQFVEKCVSGLPALIVLEENPDGPWVSLELGKLEPDHAAGLYKQQANLTDSSADIDVYGLVKLLGHMPFAIVIAARAMLASKQTPAAYLPALQQVVSAASGNTSLAAITASFRALNGALQGLILMMGATFTGQASAELLSMMSGAPVDSIQQAMNILSQLQLVERTQRYDAPYYRLHNITYQFAQSGLRGSNRLEGLQAKARDAVLAYAKKYSAGDVQSHNKLATEMENIMAVARWAADRGDRDVANQLLVALTQAGDFVNKRGYVHELLLLRAIGTGFTTAFPAYATVLAPGVSGRPSMMDIDEEDEDELRPEDAMLEELEEEEAFEDEFDEDEELEDELEDLLEAQEPLPGVLKEKVDVTDLAALRSALTQARHQDDTESQVELLQAIGKAQVKQGMENEAIATYNEALNCYEELDDNFGILEMLDMLSALMVKTENSQAAILHATRGIKLAQELDDSETRMHLLITLGDARQQLGESAESVRAYEQALEVARTDEDSQNEAVILHKLGYAQLDNGDPQLAISTWEQALALFKTQERRDYEGRVMGGLGTAYGELGRWAEAINFHTSALHIAREVEDKVEEALQLSNLGYAAVQSNQLGQAVLRYRQALYLNYESKDRENIVSTIVDLGRLLVESPRHLTVAELLIDDALRLEPTDKEVRQLKERITAEKQMAEANGVDFVAVTGSAQDYAANAYRLLEA